MKLKHSFQNPGLLEQSNRELNSLYQRGLPFPEFHRRFEELIAGVWTTLCRHACS